MAPLHHIKHVRSKKRSKTNKRQEIQPINLLEQEPLVPVTLKEFFPVDFFDKVTVNMTSCYEMKDEEEGDENKLEKSLENKVRALTIPEAFLACMDWRQILNLSEEVHQHIVVALQHLELYADEVKDVGLSMKDPA